jgi:hypothetical protein
VSDVNPWAVVVSVVVGFFLLGGLWYSRKMLGTAWGRAAGLLDDQGKLKVPLPGDKPAMGHPGKVFAVSFVLATVSAVLFGATLPAGYVLADSVVRGLVVGAGFVAASFGINYQFANRSNVLLLIDGGYHVVQFLLYGVAFGLLRP